MSEVECWNCNGTGQEEHDCGDDVCVCEDPYEGDECEVCEGTGILEVPYASA